MRLPELVHQANVAGLEVKTRPAPARVIDNQPTPEFIAARIQALPDLASQEELFWSLPTHVREQVLDLL